MEINSEYFYDEIKEGFYVSSIMKSVRAAQLEVLDQIDKICRRHGIHWFADCGTLLGAVRHGGYIPWDDDLDICMLRDDYTRFLQLAESELPKDYVVRTHENGELWQIKSHVVNRKYFAIDETELKQSHGCPFCTGVDVFVLDYLASDPGEEEVRKKLIQSALAIADNGAGEETFSDDVLELLKLAEEACGVKLDHSKHLRRQIYGLADKLAALYPSEGAREVALMPFWSYYNTHKYPIECVSRITRLPFENTMINVPAGYDEVLRIEYGDYMAIHRGGGMHDYPIFQNQVEEYAAVAGVPELFEYKFKKEDMVNNRAPKPHTLKERALDLCNVLAEMNCYILGAYEDISEEDIAELLEQSQDGVIRLGNEIEKQYGEGYCVVKYMEDYCEKLYELSSVLYGENDEDIVDMRTKLDESLKMMKESIVNDLFEKKVIIFMPFYDKYWNSLEPLYRKAISDPLNKVLVLPIPFYDRDFLGKLGKMHFSREMYPSDIELLDHNTVDISAIHPDVIYTQYAYDAYNFSYSVHPKYFTSELKKYTEELVYVPYFKIGQFDPTDEKFIQTTRYFIKIPGLMHVDKVLVESEQMRELYTRELEKFCDEETKDIWDAKIRLLSEECLICEQDKGMEITVPDKWKELLTDEIGNRKKTILYQVTVSSLYTCKQKMIRKLKDVLQLFYDKRKEVALIFRPHPSVSFSMDLFERDIWLEYRQIVEEYRKSGWGILDESEDAKDAFDLADAYYGDPDAVIQWFRNVGKPVMIANAEV